MKRTPDPAVCSSWIGGGTPVPDSDPRPAQPDTGKGRLSSKDKK